LPPIERIIYTKNVLELFLENFKINTIQKKLINEYDFLIIYGSIIDLNEDAIMGLIAHLYALLQIDFDVHPYPFNSETFYQLDKNADALARKWGFLREISQLRKKRPQKLIEKLFYNKPILKQSIPNEFFFNKQNKFIFESQNEAILYLHSFSTGIAIKKIRTEFNAIKIITNNDL